MAIDRCPSNFTNLNPNLGKIIEGKISNLKTGENTLDAVLINIDAHRKKFHKDYRALQRAIAKTHYEIVCQNPVELVSMARGDKLDLENNHVQSQRMLWCPKASESEFRRFVKERFITFFHARAWLEYTRKFDLAVGTRFHGNMLAFQAEVPALFVTHDSRTSELVNRLALPSCPKEALAQGSLSGLIEAVQFDGEKFDKRRVELAQLYVEIFKKRGISILPQLEEFSMNGAENRLL